MGKESSKECSLFSGERLFFKKLSFEKFEVFLGRRSSWPILKRNPAATLTFEEFSGKFCTPDYTKENYVLKAN